MTNSLADDFGQGIRRYRGVGRRGDRARAQARERWVVVNPAKPAAAVALPDPELAKRKANHAAEVAEGVPHYEQAMHAKDRPQPSGGVRVKYGPTECEFVNVRAGYGESARVEKARRVLCTEPAPPLAPRVWKLRTIGPFVKVTRKMRAKWAKKEAK